MLSINATVSVVLYEKGTALPQVRESALWRRCETASETLAKG